MIRRLQLIRNIGRFDSYTGSSATDLARLSLIYSENGRGKTTLCAILRSLATGNADFIEERKRIDSANLPHAVVLIDDGTTSAVYEESTWSDTVPDLLIFDDLFVDQNVYSGLNVEPGHRQGLHDLIIGREGVTLARKIEELNKQIGELQNDLKSIAASMPLEIRGEFTVDDFCALPQVENIEETLTSAQSRHSALENADAVRDEPQFELMSLPSADLDGLRQLLIRGLSDLEESALVAVQSHLAGLGEKSEAWIAQGMIYLPSENEASNCPFCGQGLDGPTLVDHYREYFGEAYLSHRTDITETLTDLVSSMSGDRLADFQRELSQLQESHSFWKTYIDLDEVDLDVERITQVWRSTRDLLIDLLSKKQSAPLEIIEVDESAQSTLSEYHNLEQSINSLNVALKSANTEVARVKAETRSGDKAAVQAEVAKLIATESRYAGEIPALCEEYAKFKSAKAEAENQKREYRDQLDDHRTEVIPKYESTINELLGKFSAEFQIVEVRATNPQGIPSSTYCLEINGVRVAVGGGGTVPGEPTFKNTLSSGDRNTLAFAFFLAWLQHEQDLSNVIVVIDDPISSMDDSRALTSAQEIRGLTNRAAQVILLSHSKQLLCSVWQNFEQSESSALEIRRSPNDSEIVQWDIHAAAITEYDRRHLLLRDFESGEPKEARGVAESLRLVLEGYLRVVCAADFPPGRRLGAFLRDARLRVNTRQPVIPEAKIIELEEIAEYAHRFHHDTNPDWDVALSNLNETELLSYVRRVLVLVGPS